MSPPEVWGPAVWRLFHTLSDRINENAYNVLAPQLFTLFVRICKFLPCPECSTDASIFLAKIKISNMRNKTEFKNTFYLFHNYVNAKKRKPLFNYGYINIYNQYKIIDVVNNFIANYHTKGNMKLLTESFQRKLIIADFKKWFSYSINAFVTPVIPRQLPILSINDTNKQIIEEENIVVEENIVLEQENIVVEQENVLVEEETIVVEEQTVVVEEETIVVEQENIVIEEQTVVVEEENIVLIEETVAVKVEETIVVEQETIVEEKPTISEEEIVVEDIGITPEKAFVEPIVKEIVKPKKNKKN
jgi:hypothetical protein